MKNSFFNHEIVDCGRMEVIMIKVIVFDLDDTLLNSKGFVSDRNKRALTECSLRGLKVGYITARSPRKMKEFLNGLPRDFIAYYNGASIYIGDNLIKSNLIPYEDGISFLCKVTNVVPDIKIGAYFEPYSLKNNKITDGISEFEFTGDWNRLPSADFQRFRLVLHGYEDIDLAMFTDNNMLYQKTVHNTAIVVHKYANKAEALKVVIQYYGISNNDVLSFGDDINDVEMLNLSGIGVAVDNAVQEAKEAADYITLSNDQDGVADYIERYLL